MMSERRLLIVEDDAVFARTLARSFERRGYQVKVLNSPDGLEEAARDFAPDHAVVDLRLGGGACRCCTRSMRACGSSC